MSLKESIASKQDDVRRLQEEVDKLQAEIAQREKLLHTKMQDKLSVGSYTILLGGTSVTSGPCRDSDRVAELSEGALVSVVEIKEISEEHRVRGRIVEPAGWISLRSTDD